MSKPKTADRGITIYLPKELRQELDQELLRAGRAAEAAAPGAGLRPPSRKAWCEEAVRRRLAELHPPTEPAKAKRRAG